MSNTEIMSQHAPWPSELFALIEGLRYRKAGYQFDLNHLDRGQGSVGMTLSITVDTTNSYPPYDSMRVRHLFPVPPAAYDKRSWQRWLFDQIALVDAHERCEFFEVDGVKPYAPSHGPGNDPYLIREVGTDLDTRTSFRGEVKS